MTALDRKLLRDLSRTRGQAVTIALVVACGIAAFVASLSTGASLVRTRDRYYRVARFAEVFASLERAPLTVADRIGRIAGVAQSEPRLVFDVTVDVPGYGAPVVARLVSIPDSGESRLNRLQLRAGRSIDPRRRMEVIVNEGFATAHRLRPGDRVWAILHGKREALRIAGVALSPEFVFPIRGGEPLPDDRAFGVFWIGRSAVEAAFDMEGAFNDVTLTLAPRARPRAVMEEVDRLLEPYGGLGAYARDEQTSNRFLADEIAQQSTMATTIPVVFLAVAAFLVNVVLSRTVTAQREQIATLKALGYGNLPIALHYLELAIVIVAAGATAGIALGAWLGKAMTEQYTHFFRFPVLAFTLPAGAPVIAVAVSLLAAAGGALSALRRVVRLAPAAAMRPPSPPTYRHALLERLGLARGLSPEGRMLLRAISARPFRFALTALAVSCAMAIVVLGLFWRDALDHMLEVQFALAERGDATVAFSEPVNARAVRELARVPGVREAEGYRVVPVVLRSAQRSYRTGVLGIAPGARLRRLLDDRQRPIESRGGGLLLTRQLAEHLRVAIGDTVLVDVREGKRPRLDVPVAGLVDDMVGLSAYMDVEALHRSLDEGDTVNAAALRIDRRRAADVHARLKQIGGVATVASKDAWLRVFEETTATFVLFFTAILTAFAVVIAVGVVYNGARTALQERAWELASLRVLGFTRAEVSALLLSELALGLFLALPLGVVLGWGAAVGLSLVHQTDLFRIPPVVAPRTYAYAALVVLGAGAITALLVRRRIDRLDLVAVLKTRE